MKPIHLSFTAFGPYRTRQEIDFACLPQLFLIRGETGAGKTVILDAMTYALYGASSGGGRGDLTNMRCQYAQPDEVTEAQLTFSSYEQNYRFVRRLRVHKKRSGALEYSVEQDALFQNRCGEWEPFFENPTQTAVGEKARELTGLTAEQFRQVMILPQGQFEKLLVAGSEDKEKLLATLFGTEKWGRATELLAARATAENRILEQKTAEFEARLRVLGGISLEDLSEQQTKIEESIKTREAEFAVLEKQAVQAEEDVLRATLTDRQFAELEQLRQNMKALQGQRAAMDDKRQLVKLRAIIAPYGAWKRATESAARVSHELAQAELAVEKLHIEHEMLREQINAKKLEADTLRQSAERLPKLETKQAVFQTCRQMWEECQKAEQGLTSLRVRGERLTAEYQTAAERLSKMTAAHLQQLSNELALNLQAGYPCPVCGSCEHPSPAHGETGTVTREMLARQTECVGRAQSLTVECRTEADTLAESLRMTRDRLFKSGGYDAQKHHAVSLELQEAKFAVKQLNIAEETIKTKKLADEQLDVKEKTLQNTILEKQGEKQHFTATADAMKEQLQALDTDGIGRALLERGAPNEDDLTALEQELQRYDQILATTLERERQLLEATHEQTRPDLSGLKAAQEQCRKQKMEAFSALSLLVQRSETLKKQGQALSVDRKKLDADKLELERFAAFVKLVRGTNGVSVQRYVLGVMLSAVTAEANRLLECVHDGRYRIYRTMEASGRAKKAGLELEVLDRQTGGRRSVNTLSGGEKFLVALALSIGLSTVSQSRTGGANIGAIFIDEGFGTLDEHSLQDALRVLSAIHASHGMVGIISHISLLRESIPAGITVQKNREGSTLTVTS